MGKSRMTKNEFKKLDRQNQEIYEGLDRAIEQVRDPESRRQTRPRRLGLFSLFGILLFGLFVLVLKDLPQTEPAENRARYWIQELDELTAYKQELKGAKPAPPFDWTVERYESIEVAEERSKSLSLRDFVQEYGLADDYEVSRDAYDEIPLVAISYKGEGLKQVTFRFKRTGGTYRLYSKNFSYLPDDRYPEAKTETFVFTWNQAEVDQLELGQTPEAILEKYGPATDVFQTSFDSFHQLNLYYQEDNDPESTINSVSLTFVKNEAGIFELTDKEGVFREE